MYILDMDFGEESDDPDFMAEKYTKAVQDGGKESGSDGDSSSESDSDHEDDYNQFIKGLNGDKSKKKN